MQIFRRLLLVLSLCAGLALCPAAGAASGKDPVLASLPKSWVLVDATSGFVMSEHDKDTALDPGELVHLMVIYTALGEAGGDKKVLASPVAASASDIARTEHSRRLYLVPGEPHPLNKLLEGIAVTGAEDAVLAVAARFSDKDRDFTARMNEAARRLGLAQSRFVSPIADKGNRMSAHDLARLAVALGRDFPDAFRWFSKKEFVFASHSVRSRNPLLWRGSGINGVMSDADSTSLVGSWHRDADDTVMHRDVFAVLLDGRTSDLASADVQALLQYGRLGYETLRLFPAGERIAKIDVMMGNREKLEVGSPADIWVTVKRQDLVSRGMGGFATQFEYLSPALASVKEGEIVGKLRVYFQGEHIRDFDLTALHDVGPGSFLSRFVDSVRLRIKPPESAKNPSSVPQSAPTQGVATDP